jgi:1-deoxy-D-xylulose-5-phosphate reductoisomerase
VKQLAVLGSTGSIGASTLDVVRRFRDRLAVRALAAGSNLELLERQVREFEPDLVAVRDRAHAEELARRLGPAPRVVHGPDGLTAVALHDEVRMVVSALVGAVGLAPTCAALAAGRDVALANKEALVVAGPWMMRCAEESGARILPVDSEHNALHQCLRGEASAEVRRLWLTASGGPFRGWTRDALRSATPQQALRHPTWKMGAKITVDSATLMNKGLELIEARWLFGLPAERLRVVVHPQSVVHSLVEFHDGSFKAQLGVTDMRHPIQYALSWPERWESAAPAFDPIAAGALEFEAPDEERFGCLALAYRALRAGGAAPAVLNAANEVAVDAFLRGRTGFLDIPTLIAEVMARHAGEGAASLDELLEADRGARQTAARLLEIGVRS